MIQKSLQGIAAKAAQDKTYRFRSLARMLTVSFMVLDIYQRQVLELIK